MQILALARHRHLIPRQLFEPYWRYLAFSAVKDMTTRPRAVRSLAELLDISMSDLLLMVQSHALPWLVLTKRQDVIQKFADARKETEPWQPCLDNDNLGPILALLLVQDVPDVSANAIGLLRHVSPHFDGLSLPDLLQIEPLMTTLELLKAAGDADDQRKYRVSTDQ
jgi:serine/threonine-protein kinase ATR